MHKSSARSVCKSKGFKYRVIALAASSCFVTNTALANPTGATVTSGSATISSSGSTLTVTNTPSTIINWHDFSIGAGETTQFIQQSAASAVLNRITGGDASMILGTLQSNGRVFLINPAGIVFGAGSVVNVAGLVASTLNITDADFLAGKQVYNANIASPGNVTNAGEIHTPTGGFVYLIGTKVENSGVINTPSGEAILAAGNSVEIIDSTDPSLRVTVSAQSQDVNLSQLMLQNDGNIFGVLNSGRVSANTVTQDATGKIYFKSAGNIATTADSITEAKGTTTLDGGHIQAFADLNGTYQGTFDASGQNGGFIETSAGYLDISGINLNLGALAAGGRGGNWLLDPFDFTVNTAEANAISTALSNAVNVTIDTTTATVGNVPAVTGTAGVGNIVVNANINGAYGGGTGPTLTLSADNNISIAAGVSIGDTSVANGGNFTLVMNAGNTVAGGSITLGAGSKIDIISSATLNANGTIIGAPTSLITANSVSLGTTGYDINAHVSTAVITAGSGTANAPNNSTVTIYDDMPVDNAALTVSTSCTVCVTLITTPAGATNLILSADPGAVADINFYGASNTLTFTQALTSLIRGVSITSEGDLTVNSNNLTMDASTINAQNNLILGVTGAFNANNSAEIDFGTGGQINAGSINFNNGSLINSNGPLTTVSGNISLDNGSNIFSSSTLTLNATSGSTTSDILLANYSYIEGDGGLRIGQLSPYRNISLLSNSSITSNEYLQLAATGLLTMDSSVLYGISTPGAGYPDSITVNGLNMVNSTIRDYGSPLSINVQGSSNLSNSTVQTDAGALTFNTSGTLVATNSIIRNDSSAPTNINVGSALTLNNSEIRSKGNLSINAGSLTETSSSINNPQFSGSNIALNSAGNIVLNNGSDIVADKEVIIQSVGKIYLNTGTSGESHISTYSNNTIFLNFPTLFSGGYIVDGIVGIIVSPYNSFTGFFTGTNLDTPAIFNSNLFVTYGGGTLAGIVGQTNTNTVATNPYIDPYGPNQTGPGDSSLTYGVTGAPWVNDDPSSQVRECS